MKKSYLKPATEALHFAASSVICTSYGSTPVGGESDHMDTPRGRNEDWESYEN